jgi:hypothetical protein
MNRKQHIAKLKKEFATRMEVKYIKGAAHHREVLWEKTNLLDEAIDEAIDLIVYLLTLKNQK